MGLTRQEHKIWAIKKESVRGTAEASASDARYLLVLPGAEITPQPNLMDDTKFRGDSEEREAADGPREFTGTLEMEPSVDQIGELMYSLLGKVTTSELAGFVVTLGENDAIDFDEGVSEFNAAIAAGSYAAGASSAVSGSLCEAIKTALEAVGAGVYTVTYSTTTKKFTITQDSGSGTLNILWKTGVSGSDNTGDNAGDLLGYDDSADDTGATAYTGDDKVESVYQHLFVMDPLDAQHPLYTVFGDRQANEKKYGGVGVGQVTLNFPPDARVAMSADVMALTEATGLDLTADFSTALEDLLFSDVEITLAGSSNTQVRQANVAINAQASYKRTLQANRDAKDIIAGLLQIRGGFTLYFEDDVERAKFVAGTTSALKITAQGQVIKGAVQAELELDMPVIKYEGGPVSEQEGVLVVDFTFRASKTSTYAIQVKVVNETPSY